MLAKYLIPTLRGKCPPTPRKREEGKTNEKKKKGIKGQRAEPPTLSRAIYALIGDEEQKKLTAHIGHFW